MFELLDGVIDCGKAMADRRLNMCGCVEYEVASGLAIRYVSIDK